MFTYCIANDREGWEKLIKERDKISIDSSIWNIRNTPFGLQFKLYINKAFKRHAEEIDNEPTSEDFYDNIMKNTYHRYFETPPEEEDCFDLEVYRKEEKMITQQVFKMDEKNDIIKKSIR
jgi:hypothetical protein